jgi:hypothetical protein
VLVLLVAEPARMATVDDYLDAALAALGRDFGGCAAIAA